MNVMKWRSKILISLIFRWFNTCMYNLHILHTVKLILFIGRFPKHIAVLADYLSLLADLSCTNNSRHDCETISFFWMNRFADKRESIGGNTHAHFLSRACRVARLCRIIGMWWTYVSLCWHQHIAENSVSVRSAKACRQTAAASDIQIPSGKIWQTILPPRKQLDHFRMIFKHPA